MKPKVAMHIALLTLFVSACGQPPSSVADETPEETPPTPTADGPSLNFALSYEHAEQGNFLNEFTLLGQDDITAVVELPDAAGVHWLKFDLINPRGALHETIWRPFSTDANAPSTVNHPTINDEEMRLEKLAAENGRVKVFLNIPVAGTTFTQNRLQGVFSGEVRLGMGDGPPLATNQFEMTL